MDFALFMERYGYKILLGIFAAVIIVFLSLIGLWAYALFKMFGAVALAIILGYAIYAFVVQRRVLNAYGEAHGKYFYDPKYGKKP